MIRKPATLVMAAAAAVAINLAGAAEPRAEQQPPPIQGVTGTIATETSVEEVHEGARALLTKAKRLFRWTKRSPAPGGEEAGEETVDGLRRGMAVVVHDTTSREALTAEEIEQLNDAGLKRMEGVILSVDRTDRTISVRLADGTRETFRLSDRAADDLDKDADRAADGTARVVVFVKGEAGDRVVHYFKRVS
jgi:hypothetical protein